MGRTGRRGYQGKERGYCQAREKGGERRKAGVERERMGRLQWPLSIVKGDDVSDGA